MRVDLIQKLVEKEAVKRGFDPQEFDTQAELDDSLTYQEAKAEILRKLQDRYPLTEQITKDRLEDYQKESQEVVFKQMTKEYYEQIGNINTDIENFYVDIKEAIEQMKLGLLNLLVVKGRGGTGKSEQIERYLKHFNLNFILVTDISEAYLYRLFYEHNSPNTVYYFKDVDKLLRGERSLLTLKTATETKPKRLITNYNYSRQNKELPKNFEFEGKLVFDYNEITNMNNRESFEALISRGEFINLNFSSEDMAKIMRFIAKTEEEETVTEFLINNYNFVGFNKFNLRTQQKAFSWYKYAQATGKDWKDVITQKLNREKTEIQQLIYSLIGNRPTKSTELKKLLIKSRIVNTLRTADRRLNEWIELGELYKITDDMRNYVVCLKNLKLSDKISDKRQE